MDTSIFEKHEKEFLLSIAIIPNEIKAGLPKWANTSCQELYNQMCALFPALIKALHLEREDWAKWVKSDNCEDNFPKNFMLRPVQRVMMVFVFRSDRLESALTSFVCNVLGVNRISEGINNVRGVHGIEMGPEVPILFITGNGSDPSKELEEYAEGHVGRENFIQVSMGGGQNDHALMVLRKAASEGQWVFFKNVHLVPKFLPVLEKEFQSLKLNNKFKMWLTTEEHPKFPAVLLETCFKVSFETPPGIRKSMERIYYSFSQSQFQKFSPKKAQLVYILSYFSSLIQERRTYIPQGWSKYYEFSPGDFKSGVMLLDSIIQDNDKIDWNTMYGLMENAIYGGRIDNPYDVRVLSAYLQIIFSDDTIRNKMIDEKHEIPQTNTIKDHLKN